MGRWKYKSAEEALAAQKAQQAAFRLARKNGTWVRKDRCHSSSSPIPHPSSPRAAAKEAARVLRKASKIVAKAEVKERREQERVLRKAERVAAKFAERAARAAQEAAERRDEERADAELERQRAAAERRETARRARMTQEERERADALAAAAHERELYIARTKYGFDLDGEAKTAKEQAGKARYERDQMRLAEAAFAKKREKLILKIRAKRLEVEARAEAHESAMAAGREVATELLRERESLERRSLRDTQNLARSHVPTTAGIPAYGTMASCQGCLALGDTTSTDSSRAVGGIPPGVGTLNRSKFACDEVACVQKHKTKEKHARLLAEYGFEVWRNEPADPNSAEELAARKRYARAVEAEYRVKHHAQITAYNREYRRRKRAEALVAAQKTWTAAEWAAYQKREASKELGPGTPAWLVREVVRRLAAQENLSEEVVTQQLIERDAIDFITQGALALGPEKARRPAMVAAALRATCLYIDPDRAVLCGDGAGKKGLGIGEQGSEGVIDFGTSK